MSLGINLVVNRLLGRGDKITTGKLNALVKSIVINLTGLVGAADMGPGAVTAASFAPDAYSYGEGTLNNVTYVAALTPAVSALVDGMWLAFKADSNCPDYPLLDAGTGGKPLYKYGGKAPLAAGDIAAGSIVQARFNQNLVAGGCWEVMSLLGSAPFVMPMVGATATMSGQTGAVPTPGAGQQNLVLAGSGQWVDLGPIIAAQATATFAAQVQSMGLWLNVNY
jgi:hypothetical protein